MIVCDDCKCCMIPTINYKNGNSVIEHYCPACGRKWGELKPYKFKKEKNENVKNVQE